MTVNCKWLFSGVWHVPRFCDGVQKGRELQYKGRSAGLWELSSRLSQVALQDHQGNGRLYRIRELHTDQKRTHYSHQGIYYCIAYSLLFLLSKTDKYVRAFLFLSPWGFEVLCIFLVFTIPHYKQASRGIDNFSALYRQCKGKPCIIDGTIQTMQREALYNGWHYTDNATGSLV